MENKSLKMLQKKGQAGVNKQITYLIGALIVIVLAVNLAPEMFSGLGSVTGLGNETLYPNVPTWAPTILIVIVAAGLVFLIWRAFNGQ